MKYFYLLSIMLIVTISGCMSTKSINAKSSEAAFVDLLDTAYSIKLNFSKYIPRHAAVIQPCVFNHEPNYVAKQIIMNFFDLMKREFRAFESPIFVGSILDCSENTNLYLNLHEGKNLSEFQSQWEYILRQKKMKSGHKIHTNPLGFLKIRVENNKTVMFSGVNQLSAHIGNKDVVSWIRAVLIQELFQMVSIGKDVRNKKKYSLLQESKIEGDLYRGFSPEIYKKELINMPTGMCGLDLWYLILNYNYIPLKKNEVFVPLRKYKIMFKKNFETIKKLTLEIENNPVYNILSDPRCSGKNTGINTKIGIE